MDDRDHYDLQQEHLSFSHFRYTVEAKDKVGNKINPIPYQRATQNTTWKKSYQRYMDWKTLLQATFIMNFEGIQKIMKLGVKHPIPYKEPWYSFCMIYFKDRTHGDPDNVWKGVNDALFVNDKFVMGGTLYEYDSDNPRIEIYLQRLGWSKEKSPDYGILPKCITETFLPQTP